MTTPKTDHVCGIDRYEHSKTYGEHILDAIVLWHIPGAPRVASSVKGAVKHGDEVEIITTMRYKGIVWAKVRCTAYPDGQRGWLAATLLKQLGKEQPGIKG